MEYWLPHEGTRTFFFFVQAHSHTIMEELSTGLLVPFIK